MSLTFGSLFAGIGGFDLGFERAGMKCKWQVEINQFCRKVLAKHWPDVPRHADVRTFPDGDPERYRVDVICGGFPCQDISNAGKKEGIGGERSGLWSEFARIVRVLRPRIVVVENVDALPVRGLGTVLGDLAGCGFNAEWSMLPLCALGFPQMRRRLFVVGYSDCIKPGFRGRFQRTEGGEKEGNVDLWPNEPEPPRVVDGVPHRVDRNSRLGNSIAPQTAEWIGRRLIQHHGG